MKKDIKDYLHFYLGAPAKSLKDGSITTVQPRDLTNDFTLSITLILRSLSDMSEEDALYLARIVSVHEQFKNPKVFRNKYNDLIVDWGFDKFNCTGERAWSASQFTFLLKCGYDLFGIIEDSIAT